MEMESTCRYLFKIILIGNSGVGKTCLMRRYTDETYQSDQASTIGVDFKIRTVEIDNVKIKLQIWDTAGQERFRAIISNYYRGAHGILVVFDVCSRESFDNLDLWISEIRKNSSENVEIIVIGNKVDDKDNTVVSKEDVERFLVDNGIGKENYYMTSAKENICVEAAFTGLTRRLVDKYTKTGFAGLGNDRGIRIKPDIKQGSSCC